MWISNPEAYNRPYVSYGLFPTKLNSKAYATTTTYNVGKLGFHGKIYRAVLRNLNPLSRYYYKVGDEETKTFSAVKYFKAPPLRGHQLDEINIAVFGDMGTFAPFGHMVIHQITLDNFVKPFDFVFLTGDIAYAGMNSEKVGEVQPIWDLFGELTESFAAYTSFMPGVGNHEKYYNYTSYFSRYVLPRHSINQTNLWFSFDYGQVHMTHFSSEHPYTPGSDQYKFLDEDLKRARANPNIKWIFVGVHRAFYSSDQCEYSEVTPLARELEDMMKKYQVDIVQTGHLHSYERSWPVYKGKAEKAGHQQNHFNKPTSPIYVVQGTAGALIREKWVTPSPEWSLKRMLKYGYGRVRIAGDTLRYQYVDAPSGKILDEWFITK